MLRDWGSVGRVVRVDDQVVGHLLWAPAVHLPGSAGFATAPVSPDAVLLATGHVDPAFRGQGLGRVLVQSMAKDLIKHGGIGAVEAFGATRPRAGECVLPVDFLLAVGFYGEAFGRTQAVAFSCVWAALALFSFSSRPR